MSPDPRTFPNQPDSKRILSAPDVIAAQMGPSPRADAIKTATPCALYGVHNSPRIVAQRGSFVLYGTNTLSMENQATLNLGKDGILRRMVVKGKAKREIFDHLFNIGISDSVVYPDLDGLSREIRNRRGFVK